jgi:hypothetical protein
MLIAAPIWLLALIPWSALAIWLLRGRRERVGVPFLALWRDAEARPSSSRAVQAPPLPIILLLLTILFSILAASSPTLSRSETQPITVLVDRGVTMSARDGDAYRYVRAAELLAPHVRGAVRVISIPAREERATDAGGLASAVRALPPTALDTSADVAQAAQRLLATTDEPVIVLSDQAVNATDPRLSVITPPAQANIGIAHFAARERPAAQAMVRLVGEGQSKQTIIVSNDGTRVERTMDAPGTAFIDLPGLGKTAEVALSQGDPLTADDRAWLVREAGWPRIEPIAALSPELSRMVETYRKLRPAREDARVVSIADAAGNIDGAAVLLAPATAAETGAASVAEHPITTGAAWSEVLKDARLGAAAPAGFTPVVSIGDHVAVAVRETPRQAWVAIESATFPRRADYVVFWTNVFDWLGQGGDAFVSHPIGLLGDEWRRLTDGPPGTEPGLWPGVYQRLDGTLRAVNAGAHAKPAPPAAANDWQQRLARLASGRAGGRPLSPYLLIAALACALGAALRWPGRRPAQT